MSDQVGNQNVNFLMTRLISSFCYIFYINNVHQRMTKLILRHGLEVNTCTSALQFLYLLNCIKSSYYHNFKKILPTTDTHIKYKSATHNESCHEKNCCSLFVNRAADKCICFHCINSTKALFFLNMLYLI